MTTVGPVCHIPPVNPATQQPGPKDIPAIPPPAQATLQSLQHTVNQLRQIIIQLTGQQGPPGQNAKSPPPGSFVQSKIVTKTVRIFQNNDPTSENWIDVERVNSLVLNNNSTKAIWTYTRPPDPGGT